MVPKSLQKLSGNSKKTPYVHKGPCFRGCIRIFGLLPASLTTLVVAVRGFQFLRGKGGGGFGFDSGEEKDFDFRGRRWSHERI